MKRVSLVVSVVAVLGLGAAGYFFGQRLGYDDGLERGKEEGVEIGRREKIREIKSRMWKRSVNIYGHDLSDTVLVFIKQSMYPGEDLSERVSMKVARDDEGYVTTNEHGLIVKQIHGSGSQGFRGGSYHSIWQVRNTTDQPVRLRNDSFERLPEGFNVEQLPWRDPIDVMPGKPPETEQ